MRRSKIFSAAVLGLTVVGLSIRPVFAQDHVKLGAYLPMTGEVAAYGQKAWEGIEIARSMDPEVLGKNIDVVLEDSKSDPIEASNAVSLLVEAIRRAGSTEGPKVREALAGTSNFQGVSGTLSMGPDGNPIKSVVINEVENGKFVYVSTVTP